MDAGREVKKCRLCGAALEDLLALGEQALAGQFPLATDRKNPKVYPLTLARCQGECGLVQLRHTVKPSLLYDAYWYRSGVTKTMTQHLKELGRQALKLFGKKIAEKVLDIGSNDGTFLENLPLFTEKKWSIDPSDLAIGNQGRHKTGFFPEDIPRNWGEFDIVFSIACFYDTDEPLEFARKVGKILHPDGLWCLEVAYLPAMLRNLAYDTICHEHLLYLDLKTIGYIAKQAGLKIVHRETNGCNGGSLRVYLARQDSPHAENSDPVDEGKYDFRDFAASVRLHRFNLLTALKAFAGKRVHLLGASTKVNTVLQYCELTTAQIEYASERDSRKLDRKTPISNIPIISETDSRAMNPDVYLVGPWHFANEIAEREYDFLERGGKLMFPLPKVTVIGK